VLLRPIKELIDMDTQLKPELLQRIRDRCSEENALS
jgi:hypothetical protein